MKKIFIRSADGSVLVIVVFTVMLLTFWVLHFAQATLSHQKETGSLLERKKAYHAARAGLEYSLYLLETSEKENCSGFQPLDKDSRFSFRIENEDGKWDWNMLVDGDGNLVSTQAEGIGRFLKSLGLEKEKKEIIEAGAARIRRDGIFKTPSQMLGLKELETPEKARRILAGTTVYSAGRVNLNTAPKAVLESLSTRMTESLAQTILDVREKKRFEKVEELQDLLGMDENLFAELEDRVEVRGKYYRLVATGNSGSAQVRMGAIAKRGEEGIRLILLKEPVQDEDLLDVD